MSRGDAVEQLGAAAAKVAITKGGPWFAKLLWGLLGAMLTSGALLGIGRFTSTAEAGGTNVAERVTRLEVNQVSLERVLSEVIPEIKAMREATEQSARSAASMEATTAAMKRSLEQEREDRIEADREIRVEIRARPVAATGGTR